ncbi:putative ankyrin repeat protein [Daldinia vernicosa]|uniref:putative ankyrin repeat protein n=1 Tax=Daldinia vernicosa TaxID=114800 RepID=UPI0020073412|nr:putative ankyrin repeat protein [Daldinia vernicosa]KAI0848150.1 putative ankyrin repeat protein [Daldinia vernicosa]
MGEDWWDDFSNNLATDLAPLISLFGENPTKQYLSECLTILDIVIFSMAPIGVITAVVSAIRVRGTPSLRAFVGRAQEGAGTAEAELCSSTSRDVCELYTNGGIARVFGRPKLLEVVHDPKYSGNAFYPTDGSKPTAGIYSFGQYIKTERGREEWNETQKRNKSAGSDEENSTREEPIRFAPNPNLSLNIGIKPLRRGWFVFAAILGIMMQFFVLVWAVLTRYHFQWTRNSNEDYYAVPLTVIGTVLLCLGIALCAYLIESKTKEHVFERKYSPNYKSVFYWVQPGNQTIGDQMFDPFGYSDTKSPLQKYITSYKDKAGNATMGYIWTAVSLSSSNNGMAGDPNFFQGHELEWLALKIGQSDMPSKSNTCKWRVISTPRTSCADITIRSIVNVSSKPEAHESEISCLVERLQGFSGGVPILSGFRIQSHNFNPTESIMKMAEKEISQWISAEYCTEKTQHDCTSDSCGSGPNSTVKAFFYRSRLARMIGLEEPESEHSSHWGKRRVLVRDTALALAQAIEETMQVLFASDSQQSIKLSRSWGQAFCIFWTIQSSCSLEDGTIQMSLRRAHNKDRLPEGPWKAEASEIEAVLGLWFWSLKEQGPRDGGGAEDMSSKKFDERISRILSTGNSLPTGNGMDLNIWRNKEEPMIQDYRLKVQDPDAQPGSGNVPKAEGTEQHVNQTSSPGRSISRAEVENGVWWRDGDGDGFVVGVGENRPPSESYDQRRFFGWCNMKKTSPWKSLRALVRTSKNSLLLNCAQEIYSSFLTAIMTAVQDTGEVEVDRHRGNITVHNENVDKIQNILIERGLCDTEDAFACTIPILRNQHKLQLPDKVLYELANNNITAFSRNLHPWSKSISLINWRLYHAYSSLGSISEQKGSFEGLEAINQVRRTFVATCEFYRRDIIRNYSEGLAGYEGIFGLLQWYSRNQKIMDIPLVWVDFGERTDSSNRQSTLSLAETIRCYTTAALYQAKRIIEEGGEEEYISDYSSMKDKLQTELGEEVEPKLKANNLSQAIKESDLSATLYFLGREPLDEPSRVSALIDACQLGWYMVVDVLVKLGAGGEQEDKNRLLYASQIGDINIARRFIGKKDIRMQDNNDGDDYDYRCMVVREVAKRGHAIIFNDMIQTWKSRSIFDDDQKGMTPLSSAIISGHRHIIDLLLSNGLAKPNDRLTKLPALHLAIAEEKEDIVELLLKFDEVKPNHKYSRMTCSPPPLICAVRVKNESIFEKILKAQRTDADRYDGETRTALWWAAALSLDSYVQKLLSSGKVHLPDVQEEEGDTPLSIAVQADIVEKVRPRIKKSTEYFTEQEFDDDEQHMWHNVEENISWEELKNGRGEIDWDRLGIDTKYLPEYLDYASQLADEPFDVIDSYVPTNRNPAKNEDEGHNSRGRA